MRKITLITSIVHRTMTTFAAVEIVIRTIAADTIDIANKIDSVTDLNNRNLEFDKIHMLIEIQNSCRDEN